MGKISFAVTEYDGFTDIKWRTDLANFKELQREQEEKGSKHKAIALCKYPTFSPIRGDYELCDLVSSTLGELGSISEAVERLVQTAFRMGVAYAREENVQHIAEG